MNVLDLLREDHQKVKELFRQLEASGDQNGKAALLESIKIELDVHAHVEETIFYPVLEEQGGEELIELVDESLQEHQVVKDLLEDIEDLTGDGQQLRVKMIELREKVQHHADEEETKLFPRARKVLGTEDLERMGEEIQCEKQNYSSEIDDET